MARSPLRLIALALLAGLGPAAIAQWVQTEGPIGADFRKVVALSESEVLTATAHGTAFRFDGGAWSREPEVTLPPGQLYRHGDRWYQFADGAVLVSTDEGRTWSDTAVPGAVRAVYAATGAFYAATMETVYATTDGADWEVFIPSLSIEVSGSTGLLQMRDFFVHEGLFMADGHVSGQVGLFRTEDGGATWTHLVPGPPVSKFYLWEGIIYGYGCDSVRSLDGGLTWELFAQPTVDGSTVCFDYLAGAGDALLAQSGINGVGDRFGVFRLDGDAWTRVHPTAIGLSVAGGTAFVVDEAGAHQTTDGGTTWAPLPQDFVATTVTPYRLGDGRVLALSEQGLVYHTEDLATWSEPVPITSDGLRASALLVHPEALLAATEDGIYRSTDGGLTWAESNAGIAYHPFHLDRTPSLATDGETIVAGFSFGLAQDHQGGIDFGGAYRSTDGGQSWTTLNETFPSSADGAPARVRTLAMSGTNIVASTVEGAFASIDEGETWAAVSGLSDSRSWFWALQPVGEAFYAILGLGELYESTDGGLSWQRREGGLPQDPAFLRNAHFLVLGDELFLIGNDEAEGAVYRLGAEVWEPVEVALPEALRFTGLVEHGDLVLAGTIDAGVWTVPTEAFVGPTVPVEAAAPSAYVLSAVHPNPTAGPSRLTLTLGEAQPVRVEVLDVLGRQVALLHEGRLPAGTHAVTLPAETLRAGTYLVRVAGRHFADVRRVTVVR